MNKTIKFTMALLMVMVFTPSATFAEEVKVYHSKSSETPNPSMEATVKWLNGYLGKECHLFSTDDDSFEPWVDCIEVTLQYKANPPTLVAHGQRTRERDGKPFVDKKEQEGVLPLIVNLNLGLIDHFNSTCDDYKDGKLILPLYPANDSHGNGAYSTKGSGEGTHEALMFFIDDYKGNPLARCKKVLKALKHLAEHAPRRVWKKELF